MASNPADQDLQRELIKVIEMLERSGKSLDLLPAEAIRARSQLIAARVVENLLVSKEDREVEAVEAAMTIPDPVMVCVQSERFIMNAKYLRHKGSVFDNNQSLYYFPESSQYYFNIIAKLLFGTRDVRDVLTTEQNVDDLRKEIISYRLLHLLAPICHQESIPLMGLGRPKEFIKKEELARELFIQGNFAVIQLGFGRSTVVPVQVKITVPQEHGCAFNFMMLVPKTNGADLGKFNNWQMAGGGRHLFAEGEFVFTVPNPTACQAMILVLDRNSLSGNVEKIASKEFLSIYGTALLRI